MHDIAVRDEALRLLASGFSISEVSRQTGVSSSTIGRWRDLPAHDLPARSTCPRCAPQPCSPTPASSYAHLLGLYLGDGHIVRCRKEVYQLSIFCDDNWPGLIEEAATAMAQVMPTPAVGRRRRNGCTEVKSYWKHWPHLFPQHGPGKKHDRAIVLEPWQREIVTAHPEWFVRGLIHSDGCRAMNRVRRVLPSGVHWYEYPRYMFKNESRDILALCGEALDLLGVAWRFNNRNEMSVARREAVELLDCYVGPKY
ncbi:helix-turn-helix domain-containing protein [Nonomuraea sp. NPDC049480]|uniref:helix-turn-helix domain-containing protein n=1 Tax=Nonomuraea sp. NPDC049480 TaxID=3364353 RepID=UPI00378800A8